VLLPPVKDDYLQDLHVVTLISTTPAYTPPAQPGTPLAEPADGFKLKGNNPFRASLIDVALLPSLPRKHATPTAAQYAKLTVMDLAGLLAARGVNFAKNDKGMPIDAKLKLAELLATSDEQAPHFQPPPVNVNPSQPQPPTH
jgi:hypothetical protein